VRIRPPASGGPRIPIDGAGRTSWEPTRGLPECLSAGSPGRWARRRLVEPRRQRGSTT